MNAQACYGHTEGAAGVTGLLMAAGALQSRTLPGIMCLRRINPYVQARSGSEMPLHPCRCTNNDKNSQKVRSMHQGCRPRQVWRDIRVAEP